MHTMNHVAERNGAEPGEGDLVLFDVSKKEAAVPQTNFKKMIRKLRTEVQCGINKEPLTAERLREAKLVVFAGPREPFSGEEFEAMKEYIDAGGSILIMIGQGGEARYPTNVNYLLEQYGIFVNSDAVLRTAFYKYPHPKECFISQGILCRDILRCAKGEKRKAKDAGFVSQLNVLRDAPDAGAQMGQSARSGLDFVFPYGATLNVQKPAVPILSSSHVSYPCNRPVAAAYSSEGVRGPTGRLLVVSSVKIFDDEYFDKERNARLQDVLFQWLLHRNDCELSYPYGEEPEINEYHYAPQTASIAEQLKPCLQEPEPLPRDFTQLFDDSLFRFDTSLIPSAIKLYQEMGIKHEPLSLIPPSFETPLPPLQPAVFPPIYRDPPPPALDLFDLDEQFASERIQLAQLTNKCSDDDIEYYVRQAGEVLAINQHLGEKRSARHILEYIFKQVVKFKKLNPDNAAPQFQPAASDDTNLAYHLQANLIQGHQQQPTAAEPPITS
ncbi:unnamed protein product [Vitrella brassicaformis CCMP3155]|uniref:ABC-type uncharacterized transport system domain-containing protein n=2 Tax=Vitrella brassicaformis TaxID=1169539 RepID=A0A0G4GX75_VITBC|nr:unnamed protein product [Vitrella brassicaformis CCMP3155]|eukprot:CEM35579.1 unnamed protein product [Vitrella brassicaformis CCMP3155]